MCAGVVWGVRVEPRFTRIAPLGKGTPGNPGEPGGRVHEGLQVGGEGEGRGQLEGAHLGTEERGNVERGKKST